MHPEDAREHFVRSLKKEITQQVMAQLLQDLDSTISIAERINSSTYGFRSAMAVTRPHAPHLGMKPMDLDTVNKAPLNAQEWEELRHTGSCFYCRKQGHMAQDCPTKRSQPIRAIEESSEKTEESGKGRT